MFALCLTLALLTVAPAPVAIEKDPFDPAILVLAKAIRVKTAPGELWAEVSFRIDYVFSGDVKLKGTTFEEKFTLGLDGFRYEPNAALIPPVKEGEIGIWKLERSAEDGTLYPSVYNRGLGANDGLGSTQLTMPVPARKIVGLQCSAGFNCVDYSSALKWARVVEKVYKAKRDERLKMLREYVYSDNAYVAAWSVYLLSEYKPNNLIPFFEKSIADTKLPVAAQVTIDDILCRINRKKWIGSKRRSALLEHWVSEDIIETQDALMIATRIKMALCHQVDEKDGVYQELDWKTWLPLMEKWVAEQHLSTGFEGRLYAIHRQIDHPKHPVDEIIISYSLNLLKTSKDPKRQRFAAKWLYYLDLSDAQLTTVKDMVKKTTNSEIRSLLEAAIRETERRRR